MKPKTSAQKREPQKLFTIDDFLTTSPAHENRKRRRLKMTGLECVESDKEQHLELLLMMIVSNNLSLSLVDLKLFRNYMLFLREDVPLMDRFFPRQMLTKLYKEKTKSMKDTFAENTGRFSVTIDEWNSSKNIDFLGISQSLNNESELKKYTIGLEPPKNLSYRGIVMFESLIKMLYHYGIKKITVITREIMLDL